MEFWFVLVIVVFVGLLWLVWWFGVWLLVLGLVVLLWLLGLLLWILVLCWYCGNGWWFWFDWLVGCLVRLMLVLVWMGLELGWVVRLFSLLLVWLVCIWGGVGIVWFLFWGWGLL